MACSAGRVAAGRGTAAAAAPRSCAHGARRAATRRATTAAAASKRDVEAAVVHKSGAAQALAAAALAASIGFGAVGDASAKEISGLTKCSESKPFAKREKQALKVLNKRLKKYEEGSAPALALEKTAERTKRRFKMYADTGVLCGKDGYPHLISDPGYALRYGHAGEVFIPTFGFLYVAGLIGYAGREYIMGIKGDKKPTEKEIIIDVPMALAIFKDAIVWPLKVVTELQRGTLTEKDENITVSPR